ncbi:uridylate kinase [Marinitoga sp. 1135]|uniref:Uridylate kinase n=1 Tax=Marinitoga piezophila (strain DSM 14283 / JCM 11233 / KA3) TaxID=443254 RepID=H2J682_MARPK|nr:MULTISPECIES: UMP kinase [Marinitoga]AEX86230.1 uridylate kinase [Marinitoga piezophila KA3]APT76641.1 uridylate kinase [Marinitoga sp. 1137]NUU96415.1 uridylate kinase [Marinitoga sp. 1135]NUU98336.1 uridylate kinase [Marinitoga sp. 1138]
MYKRILLKLSGEVLSGEDKKGFDEKALEYLSNEIKKVVQHGIKLGMVIGAGNLFRGRELQDVTNSIGDHIGMLGTVINALYLKDYFEKKGIKTVVVSQIVNLPSVRIIHYDDIELYFNAGYVVIFAGGTSNPFFTTDTAAALRAVEMKADVLIKATKVDGIYDRDPKKFKDAKKYSRITYDDAINLGLKIMDTEAFSICKRYHMPIIVLNFFKEGNLLEALSNNRVGTFVKP